MLNILYSGGFESLKNKFTVTLPDFTILTGLNGAGKTHFLQGIAIGKIEVFEDSVPRNSQSHYIPSSKLKPLGVNTSTVKTVTKSYESIFSVIRNAQSNRKKNVDELLNVSEEINNIIKRIIQNSGKELQSLTSNDVSRYSPSDDLMRNDIFQVNISDIFKRYYDRLDENNYRLYRNEKFEEDLEILKEDEFIEIYGEKPWERINRLFEKLDSEYRITYPRGNDRNADFEAKLISQMNGDEVSFNNLSSGEQTMIALLLAVYNEEAGLKFPKLLLLDEPDAFLHPSLIRKFLKIVSEVFVKEMKLKVIMTTHSLSTVALCEEDSLHVIEKEDRTVKKVSKEKALRVLTEGVPSISISYENRKQVFLESDNDILYYEKFYEKLKNRGLNQEISLSFISAGKEKNGGCDQVKKLVESLNDNGNDKVFGIIDWDNKNDPSGNIKVLGHKTRYAIENYIFDPILMAAFLLREKIIKREDLNLSDEENPEDFRRFLPERLQKIADCMVETMKKSLNINMDKQTEVTYCKGIKLNVSSEYLSYDGHGLEKIYKDKFNQLKRYNNEDALKRDILEKIVDEFPEFIPLDIFDLFKEIQKGQG